MTLKHALISVYDKTDIVSFARGLSKLGFGIIATGGTFNILIEWKIQFIKHVSDVIEFPEILGAELKLNTPN